MDAAAVIVFVLICCFQTSPGTAAPIVTEGGPKTTQGPQTYPTTTVSPGPTTAVQADGSSQAELQAPHNLTMRTLNTQYILLWDWDQPPAAGNHPVTFTTQYIAKYKLQRKKKDWTTVCDRTPDTRCDLTQSELHYLGIFVLRVRTNQGKTHSTWTLREFCPDKEAAVGPPSRVDVSPAGYLLDVSISDPLTTTNTSMRGKVPMMYYRIIYWERSQNAQDLQPQMVNSSVNLVTLPDLQSWTWYCVSVQTRYDYYRKSSSFTAPHCMQTQGKTPLWQIVLAFLASMAGFFLVALVSLYIFFKCYRVVKHTFYPSIQLPAHFQEYLYDSSPGSDVPHLLTSESEAELVYDRVSICPEAVLLEIHDPPRCETPASMALEPDSSGRHSRQGSGGSKDSGVYSTEGGSGPRQPCSTQSSAGLEGSWQGPCSLEQVKMEAMGPKPRGKCVAMEDEGVMDIYV